MNQNYNIWGTKVWTGKLVMLITLLIATGFCVALGIHLRDYTGRDIYRYLNWDIFLGWVPIGLALCIDVFVKLRKSWIKNILVIGAGIVWLLFYPNSVYLVTDTLHPFVHFEVPSGQRFLFHLEFWYHLFLFFVAAILGLGLGTYSLSSIQQLVSERYGVVRSWIFAHIVLILSSIGIYIGRFIRWNSWNAITHPKLIWKDVIDIVTDPVQLHFMFVFTAMIWVISLIGYFMMRGGMFMTRRG